MSANHLRVLSERMRAQAARLDNLANTVSDAETLPDSALVQAVMQIDEYLNRAAPGSSPVATVAKALSVVGTEDGNRMVKEYLDSQPFPHFEQDDEIAGTYIRILADGTRTRGRFVGREFRALE